MDNTCKLRSIFIFFIFLCSYGFIILNLYLIQIKKYDFYNKLAQQQYNVTITQLPPRGIIFDRCGNYLAMNKNYYAAFIVPGQLKHKKKLLTFLQKYFPDAYARFEQQKEKHFMFIKRKLSVQEQELIASHTITDIHLLMEPGRYYPVPSTAQLIGLTNIDNKGVMGLELTHNATLAGNPTTYTLKKDARFEHYYFEKETTLQGDCGKGLYVTIDANLQFLTQEAILTTMNQFGAKEGSAIIMDPTTGDILTMASCPSFDPHATQTITQQNSRNTIITDAHEPGSVIKVFAALASLEEGVVTQDELIDCKNTKTTYIDGRKINTVIAHGIIPFSDVIAFSNNIGIAIVAKRLDEKLYHHYKLLGFGTKTNIEFPGENSGFLNHPHHWSKQSIISLSYGYEVSTTLLQLACAFCTISTGYRVTPNLIIRTEQNSITSLQEKNEKQRLYSYESIETIKTILERTTIHGTARRAAIKGYRVMSKTGTAKSIVDGKYVDNKDSYICAGIIEKGNYQRVIVVRIKEAIRHDIYAATVAAPLFEAIAEQMLIHDGIIL